VHVGCEWSQEELNERLRQNDLNAGWGAAKEKKNLHTVMPNAPRTASVGSMIFYVVIRET
jgi:hypothetical protein